MAFHRADDEARLIIDRMYRRLSRRPEREVPFVPERTVTRLVRLVPSMSMTKYREFHFIKNDLARTGVRPQREGRPIRGRPGKGRP